MNPLVNTEFVFSLGALLLGMGMFNCRRIRDALSDINHWVRNEDGEHLTAYGIISLPWWCLWCGGLACYNDRAETIPATAP